MTEVLRDNLLSPLVLAFVLGAVARLAKSDLALPKDVYQALSIYLLFAIGLKGGVELSRTPLDVLAGPIAVAVLIGCVTPVSAYLILRRVGRFGAADAAAVAAHYGSVSAVTFIAAREFVARAGAPAEGYMTALLAIMESPGIAVALGIGAWAAAREKAKAAAPKPSSAPALADGRGGVFAMAPEAAHGAGWRGTLHEVLAGRTMILLLGGLAIGAAAGESGWEPVRPFFEGGFKGALTLFLLELGILAAARLSDLRRVGPFLLAFGITLPIVHGCLAVLLGAWAGLSVGGAAVLGAMAASASYIAAPAAVRTAIPQANPTLYLTSALAITFPFNLVLGIPLYFALAKAVVG